MTFSYGMTSLQRPSTNVRNTSIHRHTHFEWTRQHRDHREQQNIKLQKMWTNREGIKKQQQQQQNPESRRIKRKKPRYSNEEKEKWTGKKKTKKRKTETRIAAPAALFQPHSQRTGISYAACDRRCLAVFLVVESSRSTLTTVCVLMRILRMHRNTTSNTHQMAFVVYFFFLLIIS